MKAIEYYCGPDFDPTVGQELSAPQYLMRKINAAKELKNHLAIQHPIEGVRIGKIAIAISEWQLQFDEIFGKHKEIE